jgi:hypothetical protein
MAIQVMGQSLSQARQPVQISKSTSKMPRYLRGRVSWTCMAMRSGYWIVMGRRIKWEKVMVNPSKIVVTVSVILLTYWANAFTDIYLSLNKRFQIELRT